MLTKNALTTVLANSMHFHGLPLRRETERTRLGFDQFGHAGIAYFLGAVTDVTDQERHLMLFGRMVAGDVGVDRLELMDETVLEQEIERTVNGRRGRITVSVSQAVEQVVRLHRLTRARHQL